MQEVYKEITVSVVGVGEFGNQLIGGLSDHYKILANNRTLDKTHAKLEAAGLSHKATAVDLERIGMSDVVFLATRQPDLEGDAGVLRSLKMAGLDLLFRRRPAFQLRPYGN